MRELTFQEVQNVNGGVVPVAVLAGYAFVKGVAAGMSAVGVVVTGYRFYQMAK